MIGLAIIIVLLVLLLPQALFIVPQQNVYIIERLGKFNRTVGAGLNIKIPFFETIAAKVDMRTRQEQFGIDAKTRDNVTVTMAIAAQYRVSAQPAANGQPSGVWRSYYMLANPTAQMRSYLIDALRSSVPQYTLDEVFDKKDAIASDVNQTVSITENFDGVSIDHLKTLPASVKFITEDGHGVQDNATMAKAFAICTQKDITVMSHAEDMEISPWDYRLAEDIETVRNCWLSEYYQTRLHMCHVSTRGALDAIQMAKLRGAPVTCEVTPHHLWFTNDTCDYRVNPPIRTADDVQALVDGIRSGIVDAIATDHAPHSEEDKLKGMAGMVGSETAFGVCYTKLCKQEGLPLEVLVHLMSTRPAEILGLAKGQLEPGYDADFVLVDLDTPYTVDKDKLHSKSHNTPFDGVELYGKVCATIKGGKITYQAQA